MNPFLTSYPFLEYRSDTDKLLSFWKATGNLNKVLKDNTIEKVIPLLDEYGYVAQVSLNAEIFSLNDTKIILNLLSNGMGHIQNLFLREHGREHNLKQGIEYLSEVHKILKEKLKEGIEGGKIDLEKIDQSLRDQILGG